jgi:hypothetical protein
MSKMKCDEISALLVELKEGTISAENKTLAEQHVATCAKCEADLILIGRAFEALRVSAGEEVPSHYFTNLLPRVRRRLDERDAKKFGFALPEWVQRMIAPAVAVGVVISMIALFALLNPTYDTAQSHLIQIVSQFPKDEIEDVVDMANDSPVVARTSELHRGILEMLPNPSQVSNRLERQLLDDEVNHGHRVSTFLAADISFEDINDEEVDSIIDRLKDTAL